MEFTGQITNVSRDWKTDKYSITFSVNEPAAISAVDSLKDSKLSIKAKKYRKHRSIDANRMLWACIGEIAAAILADKWDIYLQMLKRYGSKYTYICVKPNMVEAVKAQWRESEVIGTIDINGKEAVQMLCYFGSSTYDTKEFSVLLDGVISEMQEMGLETPPSADMKRALEDWERKHEKAV